AAATIVAKCYLASARVLADSFRQFHPEIPFFTLLADEAASCLTPADEPFQFLGLEDLNIPDLTRFCFQYTQQELSFAATPFLLNCLLERGFGRVAFLKQESLIVGDLMPVLSLLDRWPILLVPH